MKTLAATLTRRGIPLVFVQYPRRSAAPLQAVAAQAEGRPIVVSNEAVFEDALKRINFPDLFRDMFAGDFGHCTPEGNRLLAANVARALLKLYREPGQTRTRH